MDIRCERERWARRLRGLVKPQDLVKPYLDSWTRQALGSRQALIRFVDSSSHKISKLDHMFTRGDKPERRRNVRHLASSLRPSGPCSVQHAGHSQQLVRPVSSCTVSSGRSASISSPSCSKWMTNLISGALGRCSTMSAGYLWTMRAAVREAVVREAVIGHFSGHQVALLYHCATPYSSRNVASTRCPTRAPSHCAGHATASTRSKRATQSITAPRLPSGSHVAYSSG